MEVEVKQSDGFFLKALVNDISDDSFDVCYDNGWRKPEWVKFEQCRVEVDASSDKAKNQQPVKVGDVVDAYVRYEGDKKAWHSMKIRDIKNCFAVVEGTEGQNVINDIVPVAECRHPNLSMMVTSSSIQSCAIPAGDLFEYFEQSDERYKALSPTIIKKVDILKDVFLANSRQKMTLLQRQEEQKKMLSIHEPNIAAPLLVEFDVSINFMGMAIGSQGANITSARSLDGIKIYANNAEAAERARNMLEISQQQKLVPQGRVGQVIGKQGKTIQDIVDKSGVLRVQIGDENPEQGMVPLTFTGTREALMYAELMVDFQLKHISEMDAIRLKRKFVVSCTCHEARHIILISGNNANQSVQPYNRNRTDGSNTRAVNGGETGDRRSMAGSGYRGTGVGGTGYRPGGAGQRGGAGVTTGRYQSNQNAGNNFGSRPQGGNRYLGRSAGGRGGGTVTSRPGQGQRYPIRDAQRSVDGEETSPPIEQKQLPPQNRQDSDDSKSVEDSSYNGALSSTEHSDKTSNKQNSENIPHKGVLWWKSVSRSFGSTGGNVPAQNRRNKADED
uniref:Agenet-like domain-containing protein n=1 Tax=Meloidogyne hapla TaxID=6305 RepID=A0A1I8C162_MELHA